ncbi:MAG: hypothetical protein EXR75_10755 [Myxococcales bacterium]|nr:hypothetical protein [Myxococcales bacterium]
MKTRRSLVSPVFAALAVALGISAGAPRAEACGGGWWPDVQIDYRVQGVAQAEKQLAAGRYLAAAGSVIRMTPHLRDYKTASKDGLVNRSMRVLAVALARSGGDLNMLAKELPSELHGRFLAKTSAARQEQLAWAVGALAMVRDPKKSDPTLDSELGEAMAQLRGSEGKAKELLEKLASEDLLTTPQAYRSLAVLRADAGDETGRIAALERCKTMSKDGATCVAAARISGQS